MSLKQWATRRTAAAALALFAFLLLLPPPLLPEAGLDMSWVLAAEDAAREGRMFGRDFIFTYGPFAMLSTRLYDPATYAFVIAGDFLLTALFLLPLLWSRRPLVLGLYAAAILTTAATSFSLDARVAAAFLAIFLLALRDRRWTAVALAASISPLLLSKFSYALIALPLFGLADGFRLLAFRRPPLLLAAAVAFMVVGMAATGHPLALLPLLAGNVWQVISGYGAAMQLEAGGIYPLLAAWAAMAALGAACAWMMARRRAPEGWPVAAVTLLGVAWYLFSVVKMGHVRQDLHIFNTWHGFVLLLPMVAAAFDERLPLGRWEARTLVALTALSIVPIVGLALIVLAPSVGPDRSTYVAQQARALAWRPVDTLAWLTPYRWRETTEQRRAGQAHLARMMPAGMTGTADVIPFELAPVIYSAMQYRPRPVPQSYSAYTPRLQSLDAAHFENSGSAPDILFLGIGDIDGRLPSLATGPSLLVAARWYDAVGSSPLGLVLRRRTAPRSYRAQDFPPREFALGEWVAVPAAPGALIVAGVEIEPNLLGALTGFLARDPIVHIDVRCEGGVERSFRFVPGMARLGFVLSPMKRDSNPADLRGSAAMIERGFAPDAACPVVAFRIRGDGLAVRAYGRGRVAFQAVALEPGFTRALPR
jgi:hypothetical protein